MSTCLVTTCPQSHVKINQIYWMKNRLLIKLLQTFTFFSKSSNTPVVSYWRYHMQMSAIGSCVVLYSRPVLYEEDFQAVSLPPRANLPVHPSLLGFMSSLSAHLRSTSSLAVCQLSQSCTWQYSKQRWVEFHWNRNIATLPLSKSMQCILCCNILHANLSQVLWNCSDKKVNNQQL